VIEVASLQEADSVSKSPHAAQPIDLSLKDKRVLVVEDSPDNQKLIHHILLKQGAVVELAANGEQGVQKALNGHFHVVLMDIQMPVMDGYAATQKLRELGYPGPVIALTAHAMSEVRRKALAVGYTDHLPKPIHAPELIAAIAKYAAPATLASNTHEPLL
jgi:CheY-like chemotaxis protein